MSEVLTAPQPINVINPAPVESEPPIPADIYQEATIITPPKPPVKRSWFGCGNIFIVIGAIIIVALVLIITYLFSLMSMPRQTVTPPISQPSVPVISHPINPPTANPIRDYKTIQYAGINQQGELLIQDRTGKSLTISIRDQNWRDLSFSPKGDKLAVITTGTKDSNDANISVFDIGFDRWTKLTVFDSSSTGITGYGWENDDTLKFTQLGWLHDLKISTGQITKVSKVEGDLFRLDRAKKRLVLRKAISTIATPAVKELKPDPNAKRGENKFIEVIVKPAINKVDYEFSVTDLTGNLVRKYTLNDLNSRNAKYLILRNLLLAGEEDEYVAEVVKFDPATGQQTSYATEWYWLRGAQRLPLLLPGQNNKLAVVGKGEQLYYMVVNSDNQPIALQSLAIVESALQVKEFPFTLGQPMQLNRMYFRDDRKQDQFIVGMFLTETIKEQNFDRVRWFILAKAGQFIPLSFAAEYREVVYSPDGE